MHQLTIEDRASVAVSGHPSFRDAHRALLRYVIAADRYLHTVHATAARTRYQLLRLADPGDPPNSRVPHVTGTATIEAMPDTELPTPTADFAARDAHRRVAGTREQQTTARSCHHPPRRKPTAP